MCPPVCVLCVCVDQAIFLRIIRQSKNPPIYPIPNCRHMDRQAQQQIGDANSPVTHMKGEGEEIMLPHEEDLVTCPLGSCEFSAGMLSRMWVPEFTYGK